MKTASFLLMFAAGAAGLCTYFTNGAQAAGKPSEVKTGQEAFTDYSQEKPGTFRKITVADLPKPYATESASNSPKLIEKPESAWPQAPKGFKVQLFAKGDFKIPRELRAAPNGDIFVADTGAGKVFILHGGLKAGKAESVTEFASGLKQPFGINFYPVGANPKWVYVANTGSVVRFPYKNGDTKATGEAETIIAEVPAGGGHSTRDLAFSKDGKKLFVSVGSRSNVDDVDTHPAEKHRANILEYTPEGKFVQVYASGIRNPVGLAIQPATGDLWCSVNERDQLGDRLVPDYITHVQEGHFYGWPWYYMGDNQDPRHEGKHPELKGKVTVPDVLLAPHNASLQLNFYEGGMFPKEYKGDIFAAEHGSWNKAKRVGYELIRVPVRNGKATGEYEDFVTGFVTPEGDVWGRPVGVATAKDGSMLFSDDGYKAIWRVVYAGGE